MNSERNHPMKYSDAGVNKEEGYETVSKIKDVVAATHSPNVLKGIGSFGAFYELGKYKNPCQYKKGDCNFYTQYIYQSKDVLYVRLFQEGEIERFDFLVKKNENGEFEVLVFG